MTCEIVDGLATLPPLPGAGVTRAPAELTLDDVDALNVEMLEGGRGLDMVAHLSRGDFGARRTRTRTSRTPEPAKAVWFALARRVDSATLANLSTELRHEEPPVSTGVALDAYQRALVQALVLGNTDDIVARRLGISPRTFRRRLATLMTRLGCTSRFQTGAQAVRAGLLPHDDRQAPGGSIRTNLDDVRPD